MADYVIAQEQLTTIVKSEEDVKVLEKKPPEPKKAKKKNSGSAGRGTASAAAATAAAAAAGATASASASIAAGGELTEEALAEVCRGFGKLVLDLPTASRTRATTAMQWRRPSTWRQCRWVLLAAREPSFALSHHQGQAFWAGACKFHQVRAAGLGRQKNQTTLSFHLPLQFKPRIESILAATSTELVFVCGLSAPNPATLPLLNIFQNLPPLSQRALRQHADAAGGALVQNALADAAAGEAGHQTHCSDRQAVCRGAAG